MQSVPDHFALKLGFGINQFISDSLGETLFHGPPYVHKGLHTKISSLFELEVLQLINGIGNQTVWEKSTVGPEKSTPDILRVESQNPCLGDPTCEI